MRRWAWSVAAAALLLPAPPVQASGPSRFVSYGSERDCIVARTLTPLTCRTAFANARAEYESRTPSFATQALCLRRYAACMVWPPGGETPRAAFRPLWDGVDIVDTPGEQSVTPSPGTTGRTIRFAARPLNDAPTPLVIRRAALPTPSGVAGPMAAGRPSPAPALVQRLGGPERPPPPGSGFKLEDGVLTYPAPARFQPKNLPQP